MYVITTFFPPRLNKYAKKRAVKTFANLGTSHTVCQGQSTNNTALNFHLTHRLQ